ncbi:LexA family protein [Paenibacillus cineris]|uniref:LexA family protein n=1 Tax=Paenibacillus cineris TaxID=237530 RepID=UPI001B213458|nr:LexA family transcriptional regulator [Paenibacillus cineris]GIO63533.1 LexA repressor [Paenibacillus cineris]
MVNSDSKLFYWAVGENIKKYRTIRNMSLQILGDKVGLTKKTIQRYENGEIKIDMDRLADIAEALDVEIFQLLDGAESFFGLGADNIGVVSVPLVGKVCCGNGALAYQDIEEYIPVSKEFVKGGEHFFLKAKGDSMNGARIEDGDMLLIRKEAEVENGEIAAVLIDDEAVLKKVYIRDGQVMLQSANPSYDPIFLKPEELKIIGKLKWNMIEY